MHTTCLSFARLDDYKLSRLHELEEELGTALIAMEERCHWSELDDERLHKLQKAEEELGLVLLAYEPDQ